VAQNNKHIYEKTHDKYKMQVYVFLVLIKSI
jgi:hypothetical protein